MRTLLLGALLTALVIPTVATDAHAHGGQYRGPGGALPPNLREPHDPTPPPPPPPTGDPTTPPTTPPVDRPNGPLTGPDTPPPTQSGTPTFTGGKGRPQGGKATITADSWVFCTIKLRME